ncbi:MAG: hypothetical protein IJP96_05225 [Synergistaceae bacterium]|nr:hypothetical protein [Synergistaceae bacterium]MBR0075133.1 hypothetical protein [Synergistaceae bacterium]MBR0079415.1 hypothetical protein [Synergistaceae bacterium]MBR0232583.1 hypothetical protein [Synergistaceae bacterium]MBR0316322.1 hypothetical protein [Synergistaceae bacterium]
MITLTKYNFYCKGKLYTTGEAIPDTSYARELVKMGYAELSEPVKTQSKKSQPAPVVESALEAENA